MFKYREGEGLKLSDERFIFNNTVSSFSVNLSSVGGHADVEHYTSPSEFALASPAAVYPPDTKSRTDSSISSQTSEIWFGLAVPVEGGGSPYRRRLRLREFRQPEQRLRMQQTPRGG